MSKKQIQDILELIKDAIFVPVTSDYKLGRVMFSARFPSSTCNNCEQLRGWEDACVDLLRATYADGGVACGDAVATAVNELDLMSADLDRLRAEDDEWTRPFARLTDAELEEVEAERPGEYEFSHRGAW